MKDRRWKQKIKYLEASIKGQYSHFSITDLENENIVRPRE